MESVKGTPRRTRLVVVALAAFAIVPMTSGVAEAKARQGVAVDVMTRNIYLGADLGPALRATTFQEFTAANGDILDEVDQTDFPRRAIGLAREIEKNDPDLIGLQEVAWWRMNPQPGPPAQGPDGEFTATTNLYDFLDLLMEAMRERGLRYEIGVEKVEFDFEAPADTDDNPETGLFGGDIQGRLTMRDVILVRKGKNLKTKNPKSGSFENLYTPNVAGIDVPVTRGWTSLDVIAEQGKGENERREKFRFVNSHLEAFDDETQRPSIRAKQAEELVEGPASKKRTILLGDFNSDTKTEVQPGDAQAYQVLRKAGFRERAGKDSLNSCCVSNLFTAPRTEFDHRVDHVMTNMGKKVKLLASSVTGRKQVNGIYSSDHAGIFSKLRIR